jgi:hypothetical protein
LHKIGGTASLRLRRRGRCLQLPTRNIAIAQATSLEAGSSRRAGDSPVDPPLSSLLDFFCVSKLITDLPWVAPVAAGVLPLFSVLLLPWARVAPVGRVPGAKSRLSTLSTKEHILCCFPVGRARNLCSDKCVFLQLPLKKQANVPGAVPQTELGCLPVVRSDLRNRQACQLHFLFICAHQEAVLGCLLHFLI